MQTTKGSLYDNLVKMYDRLRFLHGRHYQDCAICKELSVAEKEIASYEIFIKKIEKNFGEVE